MSVIILGIFILFIILLPILIILIGYHIDKENNKINVQTSNSSTCVENDNANNETDNMCLVVKGRYFINHYKESNIQYSYVAQRLILDILHFLDKSERCYFAVDVTKGIEFECENIFIPLARAGLIYYKKITTPIEQDEYGFIKCDERRYILVGITADARKFVSNTIDD